MGGKGSGKRAAPPVEERIEAATAKATQLAAQMPTAKERDAARKREERAKAKAEGKRKKFPHPDDFKGHPLADALNKFADKAAGISGSGAAAQCQLGEAWMAVSDHYFGDVVAHPLSVAVVATAQFGAVAWAVKQTPADKAKRATKKAAKATPEPSAEAAAANPFHECPECLIQFPDAETLEAHAPSHEATA